MIDTDTSAVARATSRDAELRFRQDIEALYDAIMAVPVGRLFHARTSADAVEASLSNEAVQNGWLPAAKLGWILLLGQLKDDKRRFGDYVHDEGRQALEELAARPDVVPERLLHEILDDEAAREVMGDLIYEALREFQDKVNPFFAEWGLPSLLKRLGPFGLGGMGKAFDSLRAEFEKRLEPEMRRFLTTFTGRGVKRVGAYLVDHAGDRSFIALRKRLVRWVLDQTVSGTVASTGEALLDRAYEVASDIGANAAGLDSVRARRRLIVEQLITLHASQPLGQALAQYGITARPDFDLLARVTWPFLSAALSSNAGAQWLDDLTSEKEEAGQILSR